MRNVFAPSINHLIRKGENDMKTKMFPRRYTTAILFFHGRVQEYISNNLLSLYQISFCKWQVNKKVNSTFLWIFLFHLLDIRKYPLSSFGIPVIYLTHFKSFLSSCFLRSNKKQKVMMNSRWKEENPSTLWGILYALGHWKVYRDP